MATRTIRKKSSRYTPVNKTSTRPGGETIKIWRTEAGVSQRELAFQTGVHQVKLMRLEKGVAELPVSELDRLARYFGFKLEFIFADLPEIA